MKILRRTLSLVGALVALTLVAGVPETHGQVQISVDKQAPQPAGQPITFTASYLPNTQYRWWLHDGQNWQPLSNWSSKNTYTWTPKTPNQSYNVAVWTKQASNPADQPEQTRQISFPVVAAAQGSAPATASTGGAGSLTITTDESWPQPMNTSITARVPASPNTVYRWWIFDGQTWQLARDWSSSNTFTWQPSVENPAYQLGVWAKPASTPGDTAQQTGSLHFPIMAAAEQNRQWQRIHGQVQSVQGSQLTFRTDDGRTLNVDMSQVQQPVQQALTQNEAATLIGFAGSQSNAFTARYIQQDSSDPSRGGRIVGQTQGQATSRAATASPAPVPPAGQQARKQSDQQGWQRIHGTVQSVKGETLTLRTDDNKTLTVDVKQVTDNVVRALKPGEGVTVIGHYRGDSTHVTAQYIQQDSSAGAASPKTRK
jgi:hypothetical protein